MSRAKRMRMRRIQRNRRIALILGMVIAALLVSIAFCNMDVLAQKSVTYKYYTEVHVGRGDTLWGIANKYYTEECGSMNAYMRAIRKVNSLGYDVYYGQTLMVPYYSEERK